MIDKLTLEQEKKLEEYRNKYIEIGLNTDRINKEECIHDIHEIYEKILGRKKTPVVILDNPYDCWVAVSLFTKDRPQSNYQVMNQVWNQIGYQVWNQVRAQVMNQVKDQVWNQVGYQVGKQVGYQVGKQVWNQVGDQVNTFDSYISPYFQGCFDVYLFSFYDFFKYELGLNYDEDVKYEAWKKTLKYNQIFPLNDICFVSEKPIEINKNNNGLHQDGKPALSYACGLNIYSLNGIRVPKWLVMTPKDEIDVRKYHEIENVEIKQEFIKKVGLDRLLNELDCEVIEEIKADDLYRQFPINNYMQHGDKIIEPEIETQMNYNNLTSSFKKRLDNLIYKLIKVDVLGEKKIYLYMTNASLLEECHIEGIEDNIRTVFEAICWRNQKQALPCMLT